MITKSKVLTGIVDFLTPPRTGARRDFGTPAAFRDSLRMVLELSLLLSAELAKRGSLPNLDLFVGWEKEEFKVYFLEAFLSAKSMVAEAGCNLWFLILVTEL